MRRPLTVPRFITVAAAAVVPALVALGVTTPASASPRPAAPGPVERARASTLPPPALAGAPAAEVGATAGTRTAVPAAGAAASSLTVTGHGSGNGVGLSQWGAFGYASEAAYRWSWPQIVDHYYGGTTLEPISSAVDDAPVDVNLSELDGATATTVRPHRSGAKLTVDGGPATSGPITVDHSGATQTIRATAGDVSVDLPGVGWRTYQGAIQIQPGTAPDGEAGQTWNVVPLWDYVAGVVPGESPSYWGADGGEAALQAQAVAVRSYALAYVASAGRTCDTTYCQEYLGDPSTQGLGSYAPYPEQATQTTGGKVMCTTAASPCPVADIALTQFGASSGGWTAGGPFPVVVDSGDAVAGNPSHDWSVSVPVATLEALYPQVGRLTSALVVKRSGPFGSGGPAWGGRAVTVQLQGTGGTVSDTGYDVAAALGLRSDWFRFATQP